MRVRRWADGQELAALDESLVPGASEVERRRLAALGGLAGALAGGEVDGWPSELRGWVDNAPQMPADLLAHVQAAFSDEADPLAAIYERAVTPRNRRRLGTFFTPPVLVDHMLNRAQALLGRAPNVVVDPGAGVGAFTVAAARRWPGARIIAVDINVVTLGMLAARLGREELAHRTELVLGDFLPWLQSVSREQGSTWLYLGNPPFTRAQSLDAETKERAAVAAGNLVTSGHATLSTFFAAAVVRALRPQDGACLLLPAAWTYTRSARELRQGLWERRRRPLELHRWPTAARAFTGPDVTATVVGFGAERSEDQLYTYGRAQVCDGAVAVRGADSLERGDVCPDPLPGGAGRRLGPSAAATVPLSEVFRVRRGLATGANHFFFLTDEAASGLPERFHRHAVPTLRGVDLAIPVFDATAWRAMRAAGRRCLLLELAPGDDEDPAVASYLSAGKKKDLHLRHLCAKRDPWFVLERVDPPDFLLAPLMTHRGVQLVENVAAAIPSNSLYGLYRQSGVDGVLARRVVGWLRSDAGRATLRGQGRRLRGGSLKLEPGDLKALPIPEVLLRGDEGSEIAGAQLALVAP
jgi:predicted RNA methylase